MDIYIVTLYSTGERWHTYACKTYDGAKKSLATNHGITQLGFGGEGCLYTEFENPKDLTQTASLSRLTLLP